MLAVFRGKIKTGRRTEAIDFSLHWRILGLEKFDLSVVCARARLRPAPNPRFPRDLHHLLRGIVVGSRSHNAQLFERILRRYEHELWIGDAAEIRARRVPRQKTDSRDALDRIHGGFNGSSHTGSKSGKRSLKSYIRARALIHTQSTVLL